MKENLPMFRVLNYVFVEMATHSSILAWRIPGTGEPKGVAESDTTEVAQQQQQQRQSLSLKA